MFKSKKKNSKRAKFAFEDPFILFTIQPSLSESKLKKVIESKSRQLLNTKDFFYAYKKTKNYWLVICVDSGDWNDKSRIKNLFESYPILLHLKNGLYYFNKGDRYYNVKIDDNTVSVDMYVSPKDGYREPTDNDILSPQIKLKWSLDKKTYDASLLWLSAIAVILIALFAYTSRMAINEHGKYMQAMIHKKEKIVTTNTLPYRGNLEKIFSKINYIGNKIMGTLYIQKIDYRNNDLKVYLKCVENGCLSPFLNAKKIKPNLFMVEQKWRHGNE